MFVCYQPFGNNRTDGNHKEQVRRMAILGDPGRNIAPGRGRGSAPGTGKLPPQSRGHLSRERIVEGALRAWGRRHFLHTTLQSVADELGVTKPALYRYVRGKDELMSALEDDLAARVRSGVVEPLRSWLREPPRTLDEIAGDYIDAVCALFDAHPYHYLFYMRRLIGQVAVGDHHGTLADVWHERERLLVAHLQRIAPADDAECGRTARYLVATAAFWGTHRYREQLRVSLSQGTEFRPEAATDDEALALRDQAASRFVAGFAPGALDVDEGTVERIAWLSKDEMLDPDRIFGAIESVVADIGYEAATIERIAERTGLSKSGLYHYFRNKDEMLVGAVLREQRHFAGLTRLRFGQLAQDSERLYAIFVLAASYAFHNAGFVVVEKWLRESSIEVQMPLEHIAEIQRIYSFVNDMLIGGQLAGDPDEAFAILTFINFVLMQNLAHDVARDADAAEVLASARRTYQLFAGGAQRVLSPQLQGRTLV